MDNITTTEPLRLKRLHEDSGNFRVYYREVGGLRRRLFCTAPRETMTLPQWEAAGKPLDWYVCSADGEPSHKITADRLEVIYG